MNYDVIIICFLLDLVFVVVVGFGLCGGWGGLFLFWWGVGWGLFAWFGVVWCVCLCVCWGGGGGAGVVYSLYRLIADLSFA